MKATLSRRAAALWLIVLPAALQAAPVEPVHAAIRYARECRDAFTASFIGLDESDEAACRAVDKAGDASDAAMTALRMIEPTTLAGLAALVVFYAEDGAFNCPQETSTHHLERLAAVVVPAIESGRLVR